MWLSCWCCFIEQLRSDMCCILSYVREMSKMSRVLDQNSPHPNHIHLQIRFAIAMETWRVRTMIMTIFCREWVDLLIGSIKYPNLNQSPTWIDLNKFGPQPNFALTRPRTALQGEAKSVNQSPEQTHTICKPVGLFKAVSHYKRIKPLTRTIFVCSRNALELPHSNADLQHLLGHPPMCRWGRL